MLFYHFIDARYGLEALSKRRLKISRIADLNDPFELLGTKLSDPNMRRAFLGMKNDLDRDYGLLCFSRHWNNPVMWSHYSDRHRGLCLGFKIPDALLLRVTYVSKRLMTANIIINNDSIQEMQKLLCTKFKHWQYEDEARCFIHLEHIERTSGHYFKEFSEELDVRRIIVGSESRVSRADLESALGHEYSGVERLKARAAFTKFKVVRNRKESMWA